MALLVDLLALLLKIMPVVGAVEHLPLAQLVAEELEALAVQEHLIQLVALQYLTPVVVGVEVN